MEDAEIRVHGLEMVRIRVRDVMHHGPDHALRPQNHRLFIVHQMRHVDAGQHAAGGAFDIAFDAGQLAGEKQILAQPGLIGFLQAVRRIDVGVAVHDPVAHDLAVLQSRNHLQDALLLRPGQMGLEADDVVEAGLGIVLAQLHHGIRLHGLRRQTDRFHRSVQQRVPAPLRHHFKRHAAFKVDFLLEGFDRHRLGVDQLLVELLKLQTVHRTVDIVALAFVIAGFAVGLAEVNGFRGHDRRRRVIEIAVLFLKQRADGVHQGLTGQRPGGHDARSLRDPVHLLMRNGDIGIGLHRRRDVGRKFLAVHRQRRTGRHFVLIRRPHDQGTDLPHLLLQQSDRIGQGVGTQGIGTDQLSEIIAAVGRRFSLRLHVNQTDRHAAAGELIGRFTAGQPGPDDGNLAHGFYSAFFAALTLAAAVFAFLRAGFPVLLAAAFFAVFFTVFLTGFFADALAGAASAPALAAALARSRLEMIRSPSSVSM